MGDGSGGGAGECAAPAVQGRGLVLVVETEEGVGELERLYLSREGFDVHVVADADEGLAAARALEPAAIVADAAAAGTHGDGADLYRSLCAVANAAPVILAAASGRPLERLRQQGLPARVLIARPFSPRELTARLGAAVRRHGAGVNGEHGLRVGAVAVDLDRRETTVGGSRVALTATEFDLLASLIRRPGRVRTREQLLAAVWGPAPTASARTVDVHIAQLRAKLGPASPVRTVRGVGYAAEEPSARFRTP